MDAPTPTTPQTIPATRRLPAPAAARPLPPPRGGMRAKRQVPVGRAYVRASYNNTLVTITDPQGNVLVQGSAGRSGFRGPKKSTPYAAGAILRDLGPKLQAYGLREVNVFVRGLGSGREGAIRAMNAHNLTILSIKDITPLPHNGCRPKKPRRI